MELSKRGLTAIAKVVLSRDDIDVNRQNRNGNTALIWACRKGHANIIVQLLQHSDIDYTILNKYGIGAHHYLDFPVDLRSCCDEF